MKNTTRREFLKKTLLASASALAVPTLFESCKDTPASQENKINEENLVVGKQSTLIVPKKNGLPITGTFLDEISHDIPHQN